jgi:hypothetical protein
MHGFVSAKQLFDLANQRLSGEQIAGCPNSQQHQQ